jgi:CheY-like chemotaxis protein
VGSRQRRRVLVLDDVKRMRALVRECCEMAGDAVTEADSLAAANRIVEKTTLEAAFVDVRLPDGSGVDLIPSLLARCFRRAKTDPSGYRKTDPPGCLVASTISDSYPTWPGLGKADRRTVRACAS